MKITGLQIDEFGIWSGLTIDNFPDGAYVFFGANEAGKSTLLQFVRTMLYGFTDERSRRFAQHRDVGSKVPQLAGRVGGSLSITAREQQYHIRRHAKLNDALDQVGDLRLTSRDGSRHGANRLATLLAGIDETIFNNVFAVGLEEMQHLGTLNDTQAARFLYSLSTGTDRVSLVDVMRQLQATRARLVGGDEAESYLGELLRRQETCQAKIQQLGIQGDQWAQLRSELDRLNDEVQRLEVTREKCQHRTRLAELALRVQPFWEQDRQLKIEIETLGHVKQVPDDVFDRLAAIDQEIAATQGRHDQQEQQRAQLQRDLAQLGGVTAVTRQLARIEALLDQQGTIIGLHDQVQQLTASVEEAEFEIQAEQERLGISADGRAVVPRFDSTTFSTLREPARRLEHLRELLEHNKREASGAKEEAKRFEAVLAETLGKQPEWFDGRDEHDIVQALEQTGEIATALRRRSQLKSAVVEQQKKLEALVQRRQRVLRNQLLPWEVIQALGALFTLGAGLVIWAFFGERFGLSDQTRTGLGILGGIGVATATLLKLVLAGASRDSLDHFSRQVEAVEGELDDAEEELAKLDRQLPTRRSGPVNLHDAETHVVRLESMLPLEGERRRVLERAQLAEQQAIDIANKLKHARQHWQEQLERLGLSPRLTPAQVRELAGETGNLAQLHRRHAEASEQRERVSRELEVYRERMRAAMASAGLGGKAGTALDELGYLQLHVNQYQQQRGQRDTINERLRRAQREQQQTLTRLHELQGRRQSMLTSLGAVDDADLRQMKNQRGRYEALLQQSQDVASEVRKLLGSELGSELAPEMNAHGAAGIQKRVTVGQGQLQRMDVRLKELLERRAQVGEQLRALNADRQLDLARMELGVLETKLAEGIRQWKIISAMTALLRQVYKRYEKERQPETLKEASQHLSRMTCGKYQRIWTPLDEDALIVEAEDGKSWTVDQMSRGTREQLFLALRLALVSGYARRGVQMPLVLDDVLVNFDEERTKAAAEVLVDFAQTGHQMLVFTCHQHVIDLFERFNARVQVLPTRGGPAVLTPVIPLEKPVAKTPGPKRKKSKRARVVIGYSGDDRSDVTAAQVALAPVAAALAAAELVASPGPLPTNFGTTAVDHWEFVSDNLPAELIAGQFVEQDVVEQVFEPPVVADAELDFHVPLEPFSFDHDRPRPSAEDVPREDVPREDVPREDVPREDVLDHKSDFEPIDWYSEPSMRQPHFDHLPSTEGTVIDYEDDPLDDAALDELPASPVLLEPGPASGLDRGVIPNWSMETRLDEPEQPSPMTPSARFSKDHDDLATEFHDGKVPRVGGAGDWLAGDSLAGNWPELGPDSSVTEATARRDRRLLNDARYDPVIDIRPGEEATDITEADLIAQPLESAPFTSDGTAQEVRRFRQTVIQPNTSAPLNEDEETALDPDLESTSSHRSLTRPEVNLTPPITSRPAPDYTILANDSEMLYTVSPPPGHLATEPTTRLQPAESGPQETLGAKEVISSTPDTILPIVVGGSAVELSTPADPASIVDAHKEENMSIVDRFISEARPKETSLEPKPTADVEQLADMQEALAEVDELADDDEYEYVDVDEDGNEIASAIGDEVGDEVEYEYEYVDVDDDEEEDDDEYEYVEVEVDEDGNEILASLVEDGKQTDDDEYEYVYVDEDDDDGEEVAIATGDVADDVEYEYEYVDDDEEEELVVGKVSNEADEEEDDEDDEYEYEYEEDEAP